MCIIFHSLALLLRKQISAARAGQSAVRWVETAGGGGGGGGV